MANWKDLIAAASFSALAAGTTACGGSALEADTEMAAAEAGCAVEGGCAGCAYAEGACAACAAAAEAGCAACGAAAEAEAAAGCAACAACGAY